ncbi:hypothetical protein F4604DRAFT_1675384 [Suillus subluteus]|nr:hypothetical protein F4604DRAFT_1675384 [Suillus subluteus]
MSVGSAPRGCGSRIEGHANATQANPACNNSGTTSVPAASSSGIVNWTIAKQLISAMPHLENHFPGIVTRNVNDISPLAIGSYVIMQRSQGRYLGQVVCMYKKNGGGKGTRHESVLLAGSKDVPSLTNIGLRVFIQTHPEEHENSFWHHSKSTGHLWTLASIKELVYNLGTSALSVSEGRYHAMKPWAFERWEAAGIVAVREILALQFVGATGVLFAITSILSASPRLFFARMSPYKVLGSFSDIPAVIRIDDASLDSTVSLSFLHDCNVPRTVTDHHGVAAGSTLGPVRVPTVDGWYNSRQNFRPVYLSGCDVELSRDWLASVNAKYDGYRLQRPCEMDIGRLSEGHTWNCQLEDREKVLAAQAGSCLATQVPSNSSMEDLRQAISQHVGTGLCGSPSSRMFDGCESVRQSVDVPYGDDQAVLSVRIAFLTSIKNNETTTVGTFVESKWRQFRSWLENGTASPHVKKTYQITSESEVKIIRADPDASSTTRSRKPSSSAFS